MSGDLVKPAEEILIVRRKSGGEEEGHHGGVWKIAYADFMTAMMAFFLVMWLINAANTEVKAHVASYFNPLRLTDSSARRKGLHDLKEKTKSLEKSEADETPKGPSPVRTGEATQADKSRGGDKAIDKYADEQQRLSLKFDDAVPPEKNVKQGDRATPAQEPGRAFRDPFNPLSPSQVGDKESVQLENADAAHVASKKLEVRPGAGQSQEEQDGMSPDAGSSRAWSTSLKLKTERMTKDALLAAARRQSSLSDGERKQQSSNKSESQAEVAKSEAENSEVGATQSDRKAKELRNAAAKLQSNVAEAISKIGNTGGPGMDVTIEGDSVVLSLTDTSTFGMFAIGSSDPREELLGLMKSIAPILKSNGQQIVVRGHTDARPFRGDLVNNNWRLSMLRAEAAYELLLKAGIEEGRFQRIEGYADRKLKDGRDPEAAVNRRIEILLRQSGP